MPNRLNLNLTYLFLNVTRYPEICLSSTILCDIAKKYFFSKLELICKKLKYASNYHMFNFFYTPLLLSTDATDTEKELK